MSAPVSPTPPSAPSFFSPHVSKARRFYLDLNPPKTRPLAVVCGGAEQCTAEYVVHRDTFPFFSFEYVARGRGALDLNGTRHTLQPGRIFAYGPGVAHRIVADPSDPLVKYFVDFTGPGALPLMQRGDLTPGHTARVFPPSELEALFDVLIDNGLKGGRWSGELCAKLLECLVLKIAEGRAPLEEAASHAFTTYQQCRQHVQTHFARLKTLRQIAAECHVDGAYLCRLFRRFDHRSPYQYLLRLKMNLAAELLHQPGALVKQVAEQAGFSDPFHFSRAFKAVLGLSPEAFRRLR